MSEEKKQQVDEQEPVTPSPEETPSPEAPAQEDAGGTREAKKGKDGASKKGSGKRSKKKDAKAEASEEALGMRLLRLQADFDNFRKRTAREKNELYTRANENLLEELLPVLDHMEIALAAAREHEAPEGLVDGFALVQDQLVAVLKKFGLTPILTEEGAAFDHNLHEAISHVPSADVDEGAIVAQVRKGYMLGARLLRPAQVVVSSGPPTDEEQ